MNHLVMVTVDDDGQEVDPDFRVWCLRNPQPFLDTVRVLCSGQALDEDTHARWESKSVARGGITCPRCLEAIKAFKAIRL